MPRAVQSKVTPEIFQKYLGYFERLDSSTPALIVPVDYVAEVKEAYKSTLEWLEETTREIYKSNENKRESEVFSHPPVTPSLKKTKKKTFFTKEVVQVSSPLDEGSADDENEDSLNNSTPSATTIPVAIRTPKPTCGKQSNEENHTLQHHGIHKDPMVHLEMLNQPSPLHLALSEEDDDDSMNETYTLTDTVKPSVSLIPDTPVNKEHRTDFEKDCRRSLTLTMKLTASPIAKDIEHTNIQSSILNDSLDGNHNTNHLLSSTQNTSVSLCSSSAATVIIEDMDTSMVPTYLDVTMDKDDDEDTTVRRSARLKKKVPTLAEQLKPFSKKTKPDEPAQDDEIVPKDNNDNTIRRSARLNKPALSHAEQLDPFSKVARVSLSRKSVHFEGNTKESTDNKEDSETLTEPAQENEEHNTNAIAAKRKSYEDPELNDDLELPSRRKSKRKSLRRTSSRKSLSSSTMKAKARRPPRIVKPVMRKPSQKAASASTSRVRKRVNDGTPIKNAKCPKTLLNRSTTTSRLRQSPVITASKSRIPNSPYRFMSPTPYNPQHLNNLVAGTSSFISRPIVNTAEDDLEQKKKLLKEKESRDEQIRKQREEDRKRKIEEQRKRRSMRRRNVVKAREKREQENLRKHQKGLDVWSKRVAGAELQIDIRKQEEEAKAAKLKEKLEKAELKRKEEEAEKRRLIQQQEEENERRLQMLQEQKEAEANEKKLKQQKEKEKKEKERKEKDEASKQRQEDRKKKREEAARMKKVEREKREEERKQKKLEEKQRKEEEKKQREMEEFRRREEEVKLEEERRKQEKIQQEKDEEERKKEAKQQEERLKEERRKEVEAAKEHEEKLRQERKRMEMERKLEKKRIEEERKKAEAKKLEEKRKREEEREKIEQQQKIEKARLREEERRLAEKRRLEEFKMEEQRQKRIDELRQEAQRKQEEAKLRQQAAMFKTPTLLKPTLNSTYTLDTSGGPTSYDMTPRGPLKVFLPSTENDYNIQDLSSGDSTDEDDNPRKKIPKWAKGGQFKANLIQQYYCPADLNVVFKDMPIHNVDLEKIFNKKSSRYNKRTSSAHWDHPPVPLNGVERI